MGPLIVFSDLDGTLLDHDTYSFEPALPTISRLKSRGAKLVLASSKTAAEIVTLHQALDLDETPMIVENGAACVQPSDVIGASSDHLGDYARIRSTLGTLNAPFQGFGDMSDADVSAATGLTQTAAHLARQRQFTEPGLWHGSETEEARFLETLTQHGIVARRGGRFLTLSFGATKADQMAKITQDYAASGTIALGDAPNDAEMIARADWGVVIRNDHAPALIAFENEAKILRTTEPGPTGWAKAINQILDQIDHDKGSPPYG